MKNIILGLLVSLSLIGGAVAQSTNGPTVKVRPDEALQKKADKGWFFYEDPAKKEEESKLPTARPMPAPKPKEFTKEEEKKCTTAKTWEPSCGFVDPGNDFEFQAKQRDELLNQMVMTKNSPKQVEAFQYYMRWVMGRASEVGNVWQYNMSQNPELDPSVQKPVSVLGLRLASEAKSASEREIMSILKEEGAFFVYFSQDDCKFCHAMTSTLNDLANDTKLPVYNAALDGKCMRGLEKGCQVGPTVLAAAQKLNVETVPAIFLHVPKDTWLRISTGATDLSTLKARTRSFFQAYRTAVLKGVNNGIDGRPPVDFSRNDESNGLGKGVTKTKAPSQADVDALLGKQ